MCIYIYIYIYYKINLKYFQLNTLYFYFLIGYLSDYHYFSDFFFIYVTFNNNYNNNILLNHYNFLFLYPLVNFFIKN